MLEGEHVIAAQVDEAGATEDALQQRHVVADGVRVEDAELGDEFIECPPHEFRAEHPVLAASGGQGCLEVVRVVEPTLSGAGYLPSVCPRRFVR